MIWNVFVHDFNQREIKSFNIFDHGSFYREVKELVHMSLPFEDFEERLRRIVMYYFWSKCEWEVVIASWPVHISKKERERIIHDDSRYGTTISLEVGMKIDVYDQICLNWDKFVDYVWINGGD